MAVKRFSIIVLTFIALLMASLFAREAWWFYQRSSYNAKINAGELTAAKNYAGAYGEFADAYAKQQQGDYQPALIAYMQLEQSPEQILRTQAMFNAANTYLQLAMELDPIKDAEKVFPLAELAKESYRRVLKRDSDYLPAKYNLERALQLVPDAEDAEIITQAGFERLVRAFISASNKEELP